MMCSYQLVQLHLTNALAKDQTLHQHTKYTLHSDQRFALMVEQKQAQGLVGPRSV